MINKIKLSKKAKWSLLAILPFLYGVNYAFNEIEFRKTVKSTSLCQGDCKVDLTSSPLQTAGPVPSSAPVGMSNASQGSGSLQNSGPMAASTPSENGLVSGSYNLNLSSEFTNIIIPPFAMQDNGVYVIEGFGPFSTVTSMTQLQAILESPAGKDPVVLATIVDSITPANPLPPSMTIVPLPPVIYNPTTPSNASPN